MAQQKITLDQIKSIVVRAIGSFYIVSRNNKAFFIITLIYIYIYIYIYVKQRENLIKFEIRIQLESNFAPRVSSI